MDEPKIIVLVKNKTYLTVKDTADVYGQCIATVYTNVKEMQALDRYKSVRIAINEDGTRLVNTLAYEDYLYVKKRLKHKNLAKRLPPYDPAVVREQHGEYKKVVTLDEVAL